MKHVRAWWPFTLLIFGWGINAIIWAPQLTYVKYAHNNWTMVGIQLLHSGTIIVFFDCPVDDRGCFNAADL